MLQFRITLPVHSYLPEAGWTDPPLYQSRKKMQIGEAEQLLPHVSLKGKNFKNLQVRLFDS